MSVKRTLLMLSVLSLSGFIAACQPRTPTEKAQDKVEDATHNTGQAVERAGERVKDAAN